MDMLSIRTRKTYNTTTEVLFKTILVRAKSWIGNTYSNFTQTTHAIILYMYTYVLVDVHTHKVSQHNK